MVLRPAADLLAAPRRQAATLRETGHRPWPLPDGPWLLGQTWDDLLFAHWPVPPEALRAHVPPELPLDARDGSAWLGVTPFRVTGLHVRRTPPLPVASSFAELNVRTYVTVGGRPGIVFFSLDAASALAVAAARRLYRLPYFWARMSARLAGATVEYASRRRAEEGRRFRARYGPAGEGFQAQPGSLEHFLAERYCLYTVDEGRVLRAEIHHPPWELRPAWATIAENTMQPAGVELVGEPLLHFSARQDVVIWPLEPAA